MHLIKTVVIMAFAAIAYQDLKDRQVYWFLFPLIGIGCAVLHYKNVLPELFKMSIALNLTFTVLLISIIYGYSRLKMNTAFNRVIGLGDILIFVALAFSFATISFIVLFVFSLIFSLLLHLFLKRKTSHTTVPLAGFMSLFFMLIYMAYWSGLTHNLYTL